MAYTSFDRLVAGLRFAAARPFIPPGAKVCDLGCGVEPLFLEALAGHATRRVGVDNRFPRPSAGVATLRADLGSALPFRDGLFDCVVLLAVLEHLPDPRGLLREIHRVLGPTGRLIMTWPSSVIDPLLSVLRGLRLVSHEMESERHQRRPRLAELQATLRAVGFERTVHRRFELGLNNLLVAERGPEPGRTVPKG